MGFDGKKFSCMEGDSQPEVIIIDRIGLLNTCYMLSSCAFVGGSLINHGGHNLAEPACNKTPIIIGPYTFNFEEMSSEFISSGSAIVAVSYTHLRAHETEADLVCRLLLEKKKIIFKTFS